MTETTDFFERFFTRRNGDTEERRCSCSFCLLRCSVTPLLRVRKTSVVSVPSDISRQGTRMPIRGAVYVNGKIARAEDAVIPVYDHGFLYGEGVYETLRTYNLVPFLYERHARRLRESAAYLELDVPFTDAQLLGWTDDTVAMAGRVGRGVHPGAAHARRRRADLRRRVDAGPVARHHRQAARRAAGAAVHRRHPRRAGADPEEPSGLGESRSSSRTTC